MSNKEVIHSLDRGEKHSKIKVIINNHFKTMTDEEETQTDEASAELSKGDSDESEE